jgi:UDP-N-acetylglucosamine diphosphorylase / glucose-1-phosphate thymidylyltransferase / UDP-N-acetylgalactosamine diphosphorylase / glucosamine-1-phosphate N-acetyltransferase / galactosamine-1-phosphate N-acetyltransferase
MLKCVILAAGEGKRIHPLTFTRPKVMLPVANKPIIELNLLNAINAGLKEFIFIVGYKSEMVRSYFGNGEKYNVKIDYINQGKPQGTAHAIGLVEKFTDEFIVLCGDTIFGENDIRNIIKKKNSIGLFKLENPKEYGIVETKKDIVVKIYEKVNNPFTDVINAGIYHFDKKVFGYIKKTNKSPRGEYEITDSINMMAKKMDINSVMLKQWRDVVYPWHLLDANEEILKKIDKKIDGNVEKNATIKGDVYIGKNTIVMNGVYIEGPVVIGENCKIGPNCYIRPYTSIGNACHIGNACELKNSIVFDNSNIPHQNYVGDSVIGTNCNLGSGCKVANLRLDKKEITVICNDKKINTHRKKLGVIMGDNVQTGINSMLNTGSFIGNNVFIGPGAIGKGCIQPYSKIM